MPNSAPEALPNTRIPRYLAKSPFSWLGLSTAGHRKQRRCNRAWKGSPQKPLSSHAVSPISSVLQGSQSFSPLIHKETAIRDLSEAALPARETIATGCRWHIKLGECCCPDLLKGQRMQSENTSLPRAGASRKGPCASLYSSCLLVDSSLTSSSWKLQL